MSNTGNTARKAEKDSNTMTTAMRIETSAETNSNFTIRIDVNKMNESSIIL